MAKRNVYLFIPNLIGYGRVGSMIAAFFYAYSDWKLFLGLYLVSMGLD